MKNTIHVIFSLLLFMISCNSIRNQEKEHNLETSLKSKKMKSLSKKIYVTAFFYEDHKVEFNTYKTEANRVFSKHNVSITKKIKTIKLAKGNMDLPNEIHFGYFESMGKFLVAGENKDYQSLVKDLRTPRLKNLVVIFSEKAIFDVPLEMGDKTKFYAITILNYNDKHGSEEMFNEYLSKSCAIMPEFGAHFEYFLVPFEVKGNFERPHKIHLFYLDDMSGFQKIVTDLRMQKLAHLRDNSLKNANLILGRSK